MGSDGNWRVNHPKFVLHVVTECSDWFLDSGIPLRKVLGRCWIPKRIEDNKELRDKYIERYCEEEGFWV